MPRGKQTKVDALYFLTFAHNLTECMSNKQQIHTVTILLGWINDLKSESDADDSEYLHINNDFVFDLERHARDVPKYLKDFAAISDAVKSSAKGVFEAILENEIIPQRRDDLFAGLWKIINVSVIADTIIEGWKKTLSSGDQAQFLADVFLYALQIKAPTSRTGRKKKSEKSVVTADVLSDVDLLNRRIQELVEKVHLKPIRKPPEIAPAEQAFIIPLFHAYESMEEEAKRKRITCKADLSERLKGDLEIRRNHFYAAETVRIQGTSALGENGMTAFSDLEDEIQDSVYDVCYDDSYKNGYIRMQNVMRHVSVFQSTKSILSRTGWVGAAENQGICHILAGENRLQWVYDHE